MSRNVVLVTVDSLRADHCGCYGHGADTTPTLDRMAERGVKFENAIAPSPSTPESMAAVHTGDFVTMYEDPADADSILEFRRANVRENLRNRPTIAETLSAAGYETAAFTPNTFASRYFGFSKGFDHFTDFMGTGPSARLYQRVFERFLGGRTWLTPLRMVIQRLRNGEMFKPWTGFYDELLARVRRLSEPYFLWVFLLDVHLPYLVGRQRRGDVSLLDMWRYNLRLYRSDPSFTDRERGKLLALYDATVRRADAFLDRLRADLAEDDPVYVFHADHGEAFGEHDTYGHEPFTYRENVHVPLVIGNLDRTGTVEGPVSLRSIPPTVAAVAGARSPFRAPSLLESQPGAVLTTPQGRSALQFRDWKYIRDGDDEELYHLREDPGERENLVDDAPEPLRACRGLLDWRLADWREGGAVERSVTDLADGGGL